MSQNWRFSRILKSEWWKQKKKKGGWYRKKEQTILLPTCMSAGRCDSWRRRWIASCRSVVCSHSHTRSRKDWMEGLSADLKFNRATWKQRSLNNPSSSRAHREALTGSLQEETPVFIDCKWLSFRRTSSKCSWRWSLSDFGLFTSVTSGSFDFRWDLFCWF